MKSRSALIAEIAAEAAEWRRELHRHPQTSYEETFASQFVQDQLTRWGIPFAAGFGKTGVVATIEGQRIGSNRAIAFRADMDALDIQETPGRPWASQNPGKMHACGHDGHTATVLALANYLQQTKQFDGTVRLIFQPAEEGGRGAEAMVNDGLLERFPFDEIYGFHNWPYSPKGLFQVSEGFVLASADEFFIELTGPGGHAALPHITRDLIVAASQLVMSLQTIVSRDVSPLQPAVVSISNFNAGTGATNVLPSVAKLNGTVRCYDEATRLRIESRIRSIVATIATQFEIGQTFDYRRTTDAVRNDPACVKTSMAALKATFGEASVIEQPPVMGGEDFGYFSDRKPGVFIFAGQGEADPQSPCNQGLHTPGYDYNDSIIAPVVEYFAEIAESRLPLD